MSATSMYFKPLDISSNLTTSNYNDVLNSPLYGTATDSFFNPTNLVPTQNDIYNMAGLGDGLATSVFSNAGAVKTNDSSVFGGLTDYLGKQKLSDITGLAGLGFGLYDQLWGTGGKLRDAQLALLNQQLANNKEAAKDREQFQTNSAAGANAGTAAGIAAANKIK